MKPHPKWISEANPALEENTQHGQPRAIVITNITFIKFSSFEPNCGIVMITVPITFQNSFQLNKWYGLLEDMAQKICREYNTPEVWKKAVILKDDKTFQLAIVSIGAWISNSNQEKAANKIVETFEAMFSGPTS